MLSGRPQAVLDRTSRVFDHVASERANSLHAFMHLYRVTFCQVRDCVVRVEAIKHKRQPLPQRRPWFEALPKRELNVASLLRASGSLICTAR
jgi:hypothetical protein